MRGLASLSHFVKTMNMTVQLRLFPRSSCAAILLGGLLVGGSAGCSSMPTKLAGWLRTTRAVDGAATSQTDAAFVSDTADAELKQNAKLRELSSEESAEVCTLTAREMEAHGKELAAIEQYERARAFERRRKGIAARLAVLYDRQGNHERAAAEYDLALREEPRNADLWNDYAYFQFERAQFAEAEKSARRSVELDREHKRAWVNLGLILAEQERYDEAYEAFTKAVSPAAAHNNLGIILARQGRAAEAREHLAEAQKIDPTLRQPQAVLAYLEKLERDEVELAAAEEASEGGVAAAAPPTNETSSSRRIRSKETNRTNVERQ